jgi:hypothetical protein
MVHREWVYDKAADQKGEEIVYRDSFLATLTAFHRQDGKSNNRVEGGP